MWDFIRNNWLNIFLIIVTASALLVYILQERRKITEAAALIKIQIDELQKGIAEIDSYIVDGQLNFTAFYESHQLFTEDYWSKYKHYFVKRIDAKDFETISKLYEYASEIQEQQILMKTLQKNFFFIIQQAISYLETTEAMKSIDMQSKLQFLTLFQSELKEKASSELDDINAQLFTDLISRVLVERGFASTPNSLKDSKQLILNLINENYYTSYTPKQITLSLEKYIKKYSLLEIDGTDGYKKIKKISKR